MFGLKISAKPSFSKPNGFGRSSNFNKSVFHKSFVPMAQKRTIESYTPTHSSFKKVSLIPGDGIGPEICESVVGVFSAAGVPVKWEVVQFPDDDPDKFEECVASIARNRVALKGPLSTPISPKHVSRNLKLRRALDIFANVVPCYSVPGITTRHTNTKVDLVVIRENTEGEYSLLEHEVEPGVVQHFKIVTEYASQRIADYAFQYAVNQKRKKVTAIHKANIQKLTDGLFLKIAREVSKKYPQIEFNEMIIDNCCMQLVMNPSQFDVMLTPNLYGTIVANTTAGLIGGPGLVSGANIGEGVAIFEVGNRHSANDIAGKNAANPSAMLLSSVMMLRHLNMNLHADNIQRALHQILATGQYKTPDLGGNTTTRQFTQAVIDRLQNP